MTAAMETYTTTLQIMKRRRRVVNATDDGRHKEWRVVDVPVQQECQAYVINMDGVERKFFVPTENMRDETRPFSWVCDENGKTINAIWQHGKHGSMEHVEPAIFDYKRKMFLRTLRYCDGTVFDSNKYMKRVLF